MIPDTRPSNAQDFCRIYNLGFMEQPTLVTAFIPCRKFSLFVIMAASTSLPSSRALIFDLMGTCCDWYSSILPTLHSSPSLSVLPSEALSKLATDWRASFFQEIRRRFLAGEAAEDIDVTHRRVLDQLLEEKGVSLEEWGDTVRSELVRSWHAQRPWPDALAAIERLKKKFFVLVLANGTTRLQLDVVRSSGLPFHTLLSSQLLGMTKPDPAIYRRTLELLDLQAEECVMVAAHAYDLRAAAKIGMKTAYIQRTTEDLNEDMSLVREEVDLFVDGTKQGETEGLGRLADLLGA